jgi:hypothetical protein
MKTIIVVCGNDYPHSAYTSAARAEEAEAALNQIDASRHPERRVFYHTKACPLDPPALKP